MSGRTASVIAASLLLGLLVTPSHGGPREKSGDQPQSEKQKPSERRSTSPCEISPISTDMNDLSSTVEEIISQVPDKQEFDSLRRVVQNARQQVQQAGFALRVNIEAAFRNPEVQRELARAQDEVLRSQQVIADEINGEDEDGNVVVELGCDHGWLGVTLAEVTAEKAKELNLPAERGVLVKAVEEDSPAAKAGLKAGDVITAIQGQQIEGTLQFRRLVNEIPPGRSVTLTVWREGRSQTLTAQLASRHGRRGLEGHGRGDHPFAFHVPIPPVPPVEGEFFWRGFPGGDFHMQMGPDGDFLGPFTPRIGVDAEDVSGQLAAYFGIPDGEGILIRDVRPGSPAEKAGMKAGDVITTLDGAKVKTVSDLRARLREKARAQSEPGNKDKQEVLKLTVGVLRKGTAMNLNVEVAPVKRPEPRRITRRVAD
jgi:S1-C subfamily serine protease